MDVDKTTIRYAFVLSLIAFLLSLLAQMFSFSKQTTESGNAWLIFASNLVLGLFGNGILIVLVVMISAQRKFTNLVNKMLFYSKNAKIYYDRLTYADKSRFLLTSQKVVGCYENFYQSYTEVEFMLFNRKYEKNIRSLLNSFTTFVSPFNSAIIASETRNILSKDIDFYQAEAQTMTKLKFHEFICDYVELYALWDRKTLEFIMNEDERSKALYRDEDRKHETIREIIAKR